MDQCGDVVVVDVALCAIPSLQPCLIYKVITSDSSVLEAKVQDISNFHRSSSLGAVSSGPYVNH